MAQQQKRHEEEKPRGGEAMIVPGRISWPAVFTGWVSAFFSGLILTALAGAIFTGLGITSTALSGLGVAGGVVGLVVWFFAFLLGGWVAGRIAKHNSVLQGLMVWVMGFLFLALIFILAAIIGPSIAVIGGISVPATNLAATVSIGALVLLAVELIGALLGSFLGIKSQSMIQ